MRILAEEIFDFGTTARHALGRHWKARTADEQAEFVGVFRGLLERAYLSKLELYNGEKVSFIGESIDGKAAVVRTVIIDRQGTDIPVDYRMALDGQRWRVWDVLISGVSLVSNYRAQFNKVIQASSFDTLMAKMRAKDTPGASDAATPAAASPGPR